ncbi:hypothetical protein GQ457_03G007900 [Hibiscus cannabinus]
MASRMSLFGHAQRMRTIQFDRVITLSSRISVQCNLLVQALICQTIKLSGILFGASKSRTRSNPLYGKHATTSFLRMATCLICFMAILEGVLLVRDVENIMRALNVSCFSALLLLQCGNVRGLDMNRKGLVFPDFGKWWKKLSTLNNDGLFSDGLNLLSFLCWHLWKSRNSLVFTATSESPIEVWDRAFEAYEEFNSIQIRNCATPEALAPLNIISSPISSWSKPPSGFLKISCDATFEHLSGMAAATCIVRDSSGRIIKGDTSSFQTNSVTVAEAIAIRHGVVLAINEGWENVIFESDNKSVITRLNSVMPCVWESAAIENDISSLIVSYPFFSFNFVKREYNKTADWVAKTRLKGVCPLS